MKAAIALDSVQPVPCRFLEAIRGAANRRATASAVTRRSTASLALKMAALHQHGSRPELEQRTPLPRHFVFAQRARLAEQRRGLGEIRRQAIDERQEPARIASTKPAPLSASPDEAAMTGS